MIEDVAGRGISIGVTGTACAYVTVMGNTIKNPGTYGICCVGPCDDVAIIGNVVDGGTRAIYTIGNRVVVKGNVVRNQTEYGIAISGGATYSGGVVAGNSVNAAVSVDGILINMLRVIVQGNIVMGPATHKSICEGADGDYNVFVENIVDYLMYRVGANSILARNQGYVTENSGTSTGTGAQQTIPHGLSATPDRVQLTDLSSGANVYQSAAPNGTNIYVTAVSGKDYMWSAWKA
jgi:hypothetical protein